MSWWRPTTNAALSKQIAALRTELLERFDSTDKGEKKEMLALSDIASVQAAEREDLHTLTGLVEQVLQKVASGQLDQAGAQKLLDDMNADDATVKTNIATIQAALNPPAAEPATPATPAQS